MDSFQEKEGWKRMWKSKNKNYLSVPFLPDEKQKIPKQQQKNSKNSKIPLWLHFNPKQVGRGQEKPKIKIIVPFRSYPALNRKLKKIAKKFKKLKHTLWIHIKPTQDGKGLERAKIKIIVPFLPDAKQKFSKEQQKNTEN